ncbi:MAG: carbamoyl phosphate synthase small subunit [Christensenellales bacterium]
MDKLYLYLASGQVFEGTAFGAKRQVVGQLVFNTAMGGDMTLLTDECYQGQFVVGTFPSFGNFGVNDDVEGKQCHVKAVIVREVCDKPSNFRSVGAIDNFMESKGIVGFKGVDTRMLTKVIRDNGCVNALITTSPSLDNEQEKLLKNYTPTVSLASKKSAKAGKEMGSGATVCLVDLGETYDIAEALADKGMKVKIMSADSSVQEIMVCNPVGVVWSAGSDRVKDCESVIDTIRQIGTKLPMLGIGLGHKLMAMSCGAKIVEMKYGHHGNQPTKKLDTGRLFVTYQNHNTDIDVSDAKGLHPTFVNVNDASVEGLQYDDYRAISTEFLPGVNGGPIATDFIYDQFINLTKENK